MGGDVCRSQVATTGAVPYDNVLRDLDWTLDRLHLFEGSLRLRGMRDSETLEIYYQHAPSELCEGSIYRDVQQRHALRAGGLIPDFVVHRRRGASASCCSLKRREEIGDSQARKGSSPGPPCISASVRSSALTLHRPLRDRRGMGRGARKRRGSRSGAMHTRYPSWVASEGA